jgi:hypothetical protein
MSDSTRMKDAASNNRSSVLKKVVFWAVSVALMLLLLEVLASAALMYRYRFAQDSSAALQREISPVSSINLISEVVRKAGVEFDGSAGYQRYRKETQPDPFLRPDSELGYIASPGIYHHTYLLRKNVLSDWTSLKVKVTMNEDGSRWTGTTEQDTESSVYIFGDSYVFGSGVNDEHTFAYLLQQARPEWRVRMFALGGYSLTQAYLRFEHLKNSINDKDIVILGYSDFYDKRHVLAPSWFRALNKWFAKRNPDAHDRNFVWPKVSITDGDKIEISYIQENCLHNNSYCEDDDPGSIEMTNTTAALINYIASNTQAKVYLLHLAGNADNPVFALTRNTTHVSALPSDFDYFIRDDIEGFDPHPGPYWHYAISRKLLQVLPDE